MSRLTRDQAVRAKRMLKLDGKSQREVAAELGCSQVAICHLQRGRSHRGVPWPLTREEARAARAAERKAGTLADLRGAPREKYSPESAP